MIDSSVHGRQRPAPRRAMRPTERDRRAEDPHPFEAAGLAAVFSSLAIALGIVLAMLQKAMPRPRARSPVSGEV